MLHTELYRSYARRPELTKFDLPYLYAFAEQEIGLERFKELLPRAPFHNSLDIGKAAELQERLKTARDLSQLNNKLYLSVLHKVRKVYNKEIMPKEYQGMKLIALNKEKQVLTLVPEKQVLSPVQEKPKMTRWKSLSQLLKS